MSQVSEDRLAMAQAVLRPMPSFRTHNPHQTPEQRLDRTIAYLESHNDEVRSHILTSSLPPRRSSSETPPAPPQPCSKLESSTIAHELRTPISSAPPPIHNPVPNPHGSRAPVTGPAVKRVRETVTKLEKFDDQARRTLAPYLAEKERMRPRPRGLEVPEGFGGVWEGRGGGQGQPQGNAGEEGRKGGDGVAAGGGGTYDASRDPRVRR